MSDKAAKKKQYILDTAKKIFSEKGFKDVTMKDIVEACEISRGGLYIYFDSTAAVFEEILKQEPKSYCDIFNKEGKEDITEGDIIAMFLNEQKKAILGSQSDLNIAMYEYMFAKYSDGTVCESAKEKFVALTDALAQIIDKGVEQGELYADDSHETAKNILFIIEGLKVSAKTIGITEEDIDNQLLYILGGLIVED